MDDAAFARFLVARNRLTESQVQNLLLNLPQGTRLAQELVGSSMMSVEETRLLWAEAERAPQPDNTLLRPMAGPAGHGAAADGLPTLGSMVGNRYRLEAELGRGGMGAVYRALEVASGRRVALKLVLPSLADAVSLERFSREAELAARVDRDQGVVRVFDFGVHEHAPYCAMELVEGRDLAQVFSEDGLLELPRLLRILASVADTLAVCHEAGVVHRDIKPDNVMVTPEDTTKLADFGLARDGELEKLTQTGELLGTPSYMAPEQADQASAVDGRADIYALGAILYRGITGQPPFQGAVHTVIRDLLLREPPAPRKLRPDLPPDIEAVCIQAMAKDPAGRYQDAKSFADDLRRASEGAPVLARPQSAWARLCSRYRRGAGRTRAKVHALAFLGLACLLGGGFLGLRSSALARVRAYQAWSESELQPYAYGLGPRPTFVREDLDEWERRLAWTGPFTSEGSAAIETLRAHALLLAVAGGEKPPTREPSNPSARVARAAIALRQAHLADERRAAHAGNLRRTALGWLAAKELSRADPATQLVGARLRLRLELYAPSRDPEQRLSAAAERIAEAPALEAEAREAATQALTQGLTAILSSYRSEPTQAHRLRELAKRCGGDVLERGVAAGLDAGAEAWTTGFSKDARKRGEWLSVLGSVCGHGGDASRPPELYRTAFHAVIAKLGMGPAIRLCNQITEVDPAFQPTARLYEQVQERVARSGELDLDVILFSLRALPSGATGKFIPPSLRSSLDRLPDPGGRDAAFETRYQRFVAHFGKLLQEPRFRRSRALRLLTLVAMRRGDLHHDPKAISDFVAIGRAICTGRAGELTLVDDLAESWRGVALLSFADGLCEQAKHLEREKNDPQQLPARRKELEAEIESTIQEAMEVARSAEGKVKPQNAGAPFAMQAELSRDSERRLEIFSRAEDSLRKDLAAAQEAKLYTTFHYEEALATVLRRRAREFLHLRRYDEAYPAAEASARLARKASGLKQNQDLDGALAIQAEVHRARGQLERAEEVLAERMDVGLQTDTFAYTATQLALARGDRKEAERRIGIALTKNPRNSALRDLAAKLAGGGE